MPSQQWTIQVIQELNRLWISLPLQGATRGTDQAAAIDRQEQVLKAYGAALDGYSIEAIANVVTKLCRGEVEGQSPKWCPTPPELSSYVRSEQKRVDAIKRAPAVSYQPVKSEFKDWRKIHEGRIAELEAKGWSVNAVNISIDESVSKSRRKAWPTGSLWFWTSGTVIAPPAAESAMENAA